MRVSFIDVCPVRPVTLASQTSYTDKKKGQYQGKLLKLGSLERPVRHLLPCLAMPCQGFQLEPASRMLQNWDKSIRTSNVATVVAQAPQGHC